MTTTTVEKELLERALKSMCWAARILNIAPDEAPNYHRSLENIRSALAAPATAPDEIERLRAESEERLQNCAALIAENERLRKDAERMREALTFYAQGEHFCFDDDAWDTVSGEPQNLWCDESGTATVEDGTIAKLAIDAAMRETP